MNKRPYRRSEQGVALVVTVIVVAMLAVVAVAMMQSTSVDRLSSRSVANAYRAQLAAEAGARTAMAQLSTLISKFPDSVTVWQNIGGRETNEATVLYMRALGEDPSLGATPAMFGEQVAIMAQPLVSGVTNSVPVAGTVSDIGSILPFEEGPEMIDLNATNSNHPQPWIGARSLTNSETSLPVQRGSTGPVTAARWVEIRKYPGDASSTNPVVARFAYWMEDESFKININYSMSGPRGQNSLGTNVGELSINGAFVEAQGLSDAATADLVNARAGMPGSNFPTVATAAFPLDLEIANAANLRFMASAASAGLDVTRSGVRRFNINTITNQIDGPTDNADIRRNLSRIVAAITNTNAAPLFGQRFYRETGTSGGSINDTNFVDTDSSPSSENHSQIYLNKIAANILDYLDPNNAPTILSNALGYPVWSGRPDFGVEPLGGGTDGLNSSVAFGVENGPKLQEYAIHGRIIEMTPIGYKASSAPSNPTASYKINIDHYFEFWNPGNADVTITNGFLKLYDQPGYGQKITGELREEGRPIELAVENVTFKAGSLTVLTTAPEDERNQALLQGSANVFTISPKDGRDSHRVFRGETSDVSTGNYAGFDRFFNVSLRPRSSRLTDYQSAVLLGDANGIIESFVGLPIVVSGGNVPAMHFVVSSAAAQAVVGPSRSAASDLYFTRGGSLRGNSTAADSPTSAEGDPRALNEQLEILLYQPDGSPDQTRFFTSNLGNGNVPASSSLGKPNTNYVAAAKWVDFSDLAPAIDNAPLRVANQAMASIGELGHITDPARVRGTASGIELARGGGRTLRVGQPELPSWYDGNQTNASRTWTSWRLADIFTTKTNLVVPGVVNPNGALRDNGAALRAMLQGFTFLNSPDGAPTLAGNLLDYNNGLVLVTNAIARLTNSTGVNPPGAVNPFWERGELSELSVFNQGSGFADGNMAATLDRGREEFVRRSIELITTRGSVFSVYVVGQALQSSPNATNVLSTARLKTTFQILPQFALSATNDSFDPDSGGAIAARFQPPTNYVIRVISSQYD